MARRTAAPDSALGEAWRNGDENENWGWGIAGSAAIQVE